MTREYTIKVEFAKGATYAIQLNPAERRYGELSQKVIQRLQNAFLQPLPRPDHIVIESVLRKAVITPETLQAHGLAYFLPSGGSCVGGDLKISIGRFLLSRMLLRLWQRSNRVSQTARHRFSLGLKRIGRSLVSQCCFSLSEECMEPRSPQRGLPGRKTPIGIEKHLMQQHPMSVVSSQEESSLSYVKASKPCV